ncbi:MAG: hypothetical protein ACT6Q9_12025 [Polaromonas sp.]|uniref:hypothetical protein n=1 Tax=Polaromonas sp. TaxID=1869339 RepID=UPI004035F50C
MKNLNFVFLFWLSLVSTAQAAGFTDQSGLLWQLSPQPVQIKYASDTCNKLSIGGKPGRVPSVKEVHELYKYARPRTGWINPDFPPVFEPPMDKQQIANYENVRRTLVTNTGNVDGHLPTQSDRNTSEDIWMFAIQTGREQTMFGSWQTYVLCVGTAPTKSAAKKEEPKTASKSSANLSGPTLNRVVPKETDGERNAREGKAGAVESARKINELKAQRDAADAKNRAAEASRAKKPVTGDR